MPHASPSHGECVANVPTAAPHAPISIMPSSAMLITPARSLNIPPIAAKISGIETRNVEASNCVSMLPSVVFIQLHSPSAETDKIISACNTSDNSRVTCSVSMSRSDVPLCSAPNKQRRRHHAHRLVSSQQRHRDSQKPVLRRKSQPEFPRIAQNFRHAHQPRQSRPPATSR